jgi:sulfate adenylyltransferase
MGKEDYQRVLDEMRLLSGQIFPIPITLPVEANPDIHLDRDITLRNNENELVAVMTINEIYKWDRTEFADKVFGTRDSRHPLVSESQSWGTLNISGRLQIMHLPSHYDFQDLRLTPSQTRSKLTDMGHKNVVAYQPHYPLPHIDERLIEKAMGDVDGILLLYLTVGLAKLGDVDHYTQIRIYNDLVERYFNPDRILLLLSPLAPRKAGIREALWQALVFRNYGANHMIVSRNHASPGIFSDNGDSENPQDAQKLLEKFIQELGVKMVPEQKKYEDMTNVSEGATTPSKSKDPVFNQYPNNGKNRTGRDIQRDITVVLAENYPPRNQQGVCIWFTGLSGSGKSTTAEILTWLLLEHGRRVTVLDGDVVRTHLSKGLGFSKEDRDTNVRRIGFVASELVRHGGIVICAVVSPYRAARNDVRKMVGDDQFVEVFVNTPLEVCESRDVKGMYAKARRGELNGFTGIDNPYEPPLDPEITLDTVNYTQQENANFVIEYLIEQGFIHSKDIKRNL